MQGNMRKIRQRTLVLARTKSVETRHKGKVTILWTLQVQTDRTIPNKKPDIIIRDNGKRARMLADVAISGNTSVIKKQDEMMLKQTP